MANRHLLTSVTSLLLILAAVYSFFFISPPIAILIGPGAYAFLSSFIIMRIFKKYRPEMDPDPAQEIQEIEAAKELERRRQRMEAAELNRENKEAVVTEADAFWAIQEEDAAAVTDDSIFGDENEEAEGDIWAQLRKAGDAEKKSRGEYEV